MMTEHCSAVADQAAAVVEAGDAEAGDAVAGYSLREHYSIVEGHCILKKHIFEYCRELKMYETTYLFGGPL